MHTYIHTNIHTLHYITLHYTTLHYITLHYITLHYITLHYIPYMHISWHWWGGKIFMMSGLAGWPCQVPPGVAEGAAGAAGEGREPSRLWAKAGDMDRPGECNQQKMVKMGVYSIDLCLDWVYETDALEIRCEFFTLQKSRADGFWWEHQGMPCPKFSCTHIMDTRISCINILDQNSRPQNFAQWGANFFLKFCFPIASYSYVYKL